MLQFNQGGMYMDNMIDTSLLELEENKKNVLVVDDSNLMTNFIGKVLSNEYNVVKMHNGIEALAILSTNAINISALILDLNMPGINGMEVLEKMNEQGLLNKVPVLVLSGEEDPDAVTKVLSYPNVQLITKGVNGGAKDIKNALEVLMQNFN